jgi:hypothetical protein
LPLFKVVEAPLIFFLQLFSGVIFSSLRVYGLQKIIPKPVYTSNRRIPEMKRTYLKILLITLIVSTIILSGIHVTFGVH